MGLAETEIELRMGERVVGTVSVPFSPGEIQELQEALALRRELSSLALRSTGQMRDWYVDVGIPWGHALASRAAALESIKRAADYTANLLPEFKRTHSYADVLPKLELIAEKLKHLSLGNTEARD